MQISDANRDMLYGYARVSTAAQTAGETQRSIARSHNVSQSTIARLPAPESYI